MSITYITSINTGGGTWVTECLRCADTL